MRRKRDFRGVVARWIGLSPFVALAVVVTDGCGGTSTEREGSAGASADAGEASTTGGTGGATSQGGSSTSGGMAGTAARGGTSSGGEAGSSAAGGEAGSNAMGGEAGSNATGGATGGTLPVCTPAMGGAPAGAAGESHGGEGGTDEPAMCTCSASAVVSCRANWAALCLPIVGCKPSLEDARRRLAEESIGSYSECDDNLARINVYDGREDEDYLYELVFDRTTGKLLYGRADGSLQRCDGMGGADDSATHISAAGPAPVLSGCVDCRFCAPSSEAASGFGDF